jgi:hypothetical protein
MRRVIYCVGGVLSPLLANVALPALDDHFAGQWQQQMKTPYQRQARRKRGQGNWRMIRFADLCRRRHKSAYAEDRVMPILAMESLVRVVSGFLVSA